LFKKAVFVSLPAVLSLAIIFNVLVSPTFNGGVIFQTPVP
jgi:hypothetical protein